MTKILMTWEEDQEGNRIPFTFAQIEGYEAAYWHGQLDVLVGYMNGVWYQNYDTRRTVYTWF